MQARNAEGESMIAHANDIIEQVFGQGGSLFANFWQNLVVSAMGLPG